MKLPYRAVVSVFLLAALATLAVHSDVTSDHRWQYPAIEDIAADYDAHTGDQVFLFGTVQARHDDGFTMETGGISLRATGTSTNVAVGNVVQVYGTLRPDNRIAAQGVVVVTRTKVSTTYKYGVSLVGAVLFCVLFFQNWRPDTETWTVEPRDG